MFLLSALSDHVNYGFCVRYVFDTKTIDQLESFLYLGQLIFRLYCHYGWNKSLKILNNNYFIFRFLGWGNLRNNLTALIWIFDYERIFDLIWKEIRIYICYCAFYLLRSVHVVFKDIGYTSLVSVCSIANRFKIDRIINLIDQFFWYKWYFGDKLMLVDGSIGINIKPIRVVVIWMS